jgi:hypothetical protein
MTRKKDQAVRKGLQKVQDMELGQGENPEMDMEKMDEGEKELFLSVVRAVVSAVHKTQPIQQVANMEAYFTSCSRTALVYAGLHVREMRKLKKVFEEG